MESVRLQLLELQNAKQALEINELKQTIENLHQTYGKTIASLKKVHLNASEAMETKMRALDIELSTLKLERSILQASFQTQLDAHVSRITSLENSRQDLFQRVFADSNRQMTEMIVTLKYEHDVEIEQLRKQYADMRKESKLSLQSEKVLEKIESSKSESNAVEEDKAQTYGGPEKQAQTSILGRKLLKEELDMKLSSYQSGISASKVNNEAAEQRFETKLCDHIKDFEQYHKDVIKKKDRDLELLKYKLQSDYMLSLEKLKAQYDGDTSSLIDPIFRDTIKPLTMPKSI